MVKKELKTFAKTLYEKSPHQNLYALKKKILRSSTPTSQPSIPKERNQVLENVIESETWGELLGWKLNHIKEKSFMMLGDKLSLSKWNIKEHAYECNIDIKDWNWEAIPKEAVPEDSYLVLCREPISMESWNSIDQLKEVFGSRVLLLTELLLPFTQFSFLLSKLEYYKKTLEENIPYYLGKAYFGPLEELNKNYNLADKRVVEFGPLDGFQTSGLIHLGVKSLDCVEARAENVSKITALRQAMEWGNLKVIMDDFHNFNAQKYRRYDLAFAHGVYYHSIHPFIFLNNLITLSDTIFLGGFCATDSLPDTSWMTLKYQEKKYRVKQYVEWNRFTAGINSFGYFFHPDDLILFFKEKGYNVLVMDREKSEVTAGCYLRFIAKKT